MTEKIHQQVSVAAIYHVAKGEVMPWKVKWNGRTYHITKLGYHHKIKDGRYVHHVFSVCSDTLFFKLILNTETLHWWLEEVSDGLAS